MPTPVSSRADVFENAREYERTVAEVESFPTEHQTTILRTITHAQAWVAVREFTKDRWYVVPVKYGSMQGVSIARYDRSREAHIDVNQGLKALREMGYEEVGPKHPASQAVRQLARKAGVSARASHRVLVLDGEDLPTSERQTVEGLLATIRGANLSAASREFIATQVTL